MTCKLEFVHVKRHDIIKLVFYIKVSILGTGEVCMELLKGQGAQERVKEVLRISCDGSMVRDSEVNSLCNLLLDQ